MVNFLSGRFLRKKPIYSKIYFMSIVRFIGLRYSYESYRCAIYTFTCTKTIKTNRRSRRTLTNHQYGILPSIFYHFARESSRPVPDFFISPSSPRLDQLKHPTAGHVMQRRRKKKHPPASPPGTITRRRAQQQVHFNALPGKRETR